MLLLYPHTTARNEGKGIRLGLKKKGIRIRKKKKAKASVFVKAIS
jgi:hypothetical protein